MPKQKLEKITPARRTALVELATELGGAKLAVEVALAADEPEQYLEQFRQQMEDIYVDAPRDDLAWLALISALSKRGKLLEFDWKHESADALAQLERLAGAAGRKVLKPLRADPELEQRFTDEALALFGKTLATAKLALIQLDKMSDSYAVMVVPAADVANLAKLAKRGQGAIIVFGKQLAALEKERRAKRKR